jgi:iron complex transport system ATP-binding protein
VLDEPTAALDLRHQQLMVQTCRRAVHRGHAVVVVLHDLELAARCADRVAVLRRGIVLASGAPDAVLTSDLVSRAFDVALEVTRLRPVRCSCSRADDPRIAVFARHSSLI